MITKLLISALCNAVLAVFLYEIERKTAFHYLNYKVKQVIYGICFGLLAIYSSTSMGGVDLGYVILNVRDSAPLCAGLIFGGPAGVIAGVIGGGYRYIATMLGFAGTYTQLACSISTILTGIIAATLRKYMFDGKKPTWIFGVGIAIICEILHMMMIFFTNMNDPSTAFYYVQAASVPMILCNAVAAGLALLSIGLLAKEGIGMKKRRHYISNTFQFWLFICIAIAFVFTSLFTSTIQSRISESETADIIETNIKDVYQDILDASDENLLEKTKKIKEEYEQGASLSELIKKYNVSEINLIDEDGIIRESNDAAYLGYNMASNQQSKEFLVLLNGDLQEYVQKYQPRAFDQKTYRKYGAVTMTKGFLQVGYDAEQFTQEIETFVGKVAKNRHIGKKGFILLCDEELNIVTEGLKVSGENIISLGLNLDMNRTNEKDIFEIQIHDEAYLCTYRFVESYYIIGLMPISEAMYMKDVSIHINLFMELVVFAVLFVLIYFLVKTIVLDNLIKVNGKLAEITNGNLDVTVDVRSNEEFASLSDDINATVNTLKRYITEAAERIDKELEFAKQIQYSSLPSVIQSQGLFDIYADMRTAKEVGGDFYDYYLLSDSRLAFLMADVSGKGIPAAMFMMRAKTTIKDLAEQGLEPDEIFTIANERLCANNEAFMFVTAWMGILDLKTGHMKFVNAGHNPPLLCRRDGEFEYLRVRSGLTLAAMEGIQYHKNEMQMEPGDRIYLYTDGVTEATSCEEELYGEERLKTLMNSLGNVSSEQLCHEIRDSVDAFVGKAPQFDDITMLGITFHAALSENKIKLVPEDVSSEAVNKFIDGLVNKLEILPKIANRIRIIFDEIYSNIVFYSKATITEISYRIEDGKLYLTFEDNGVPYDPLSAKEPNISLDAEDRNLGGLGVLMVKKMSDHSEYTYEDGKNILVICISLRG